MVVPAEEGQNAEEEAIEPPGLEDRIVYQFVKAVDQEMPEVSVDEDQ